MSKSSIVLFPLLLLLLLVIHLGICTAISNSLGLGPQNVQVAAAAASPSCRGTIGECVEGEREEEMDSESNRRLLVVMGKKYISYETLKRDIVPCNTPGASYYRCDAAQANPYTRGCQVIAGCRNSITAINN